MIRKYEGFQPETAAYRDDTDSNLRALIPGSGNAVFGMEKDGSSSTQADKYVEFIVHHLMPFNRYPDTLFVEGS